MLAKIRRRLASKHSFDKESSSYGGGEDDDNDDVHTFTPPTNYIKISQGKIQLVNQSKLLDNDTTTTNESNSKKDKEVLENRIYELEGALQRLQAKVEKNNESGSPIFEKELREQLESMTRVIKSKERKQQQSCRDHKVLQLRFTQQEQLLQVLQQENKALLLRVRQYEHCLDDVMRKVVDAIVAEDNLREEVSMLKGRVRDLEAQNAQLSGGSPAKGRDEGYCTMSSGQPQPSNGHLEDLPEEPEQWLLPAEPCSTEMEDWSMSQEELAVITLDEEREQHQHPGKRCNGENEWIWNSNDFLNSTLAETESVCDGISQLLQQKIVYSEDEEVACTDFTNDFYKLVNIRSGSARSLYSCIEGDTDDEDEDEDEEEEEEDDDDDDDDEAEDSSLSSNKRVRLRSRTTTNNKNGTLPSPTPSEAGRAQVTSCSSSESDERSLCTGLQESLTIHLEEDDSMQDPMESIETGNNVCNHQESDIEIEEVQLDTDTERRAHDKILTPLDEKQCIEEFIKTELRRPPHILVKSKSTVDEEEPSCILRNNQRREIESGVVRSGSANCAIASKIVSSSIYNTKSQGRLSLEQRPQNSWRKSNGWKRVTSPAHSPVVSPKKETITTTCTTNKQLPTRIPTCIVSALPPLQNTQLHNVTTKQQSPSQHQQQLKQRKSKIPPPVPVRRSYAS